MEPIKIYREELIDHYLENGGICPVDGPENQVSMQTMDIDIESIIIIDKLKL